MFVERIRTWLRLTSRGELHAEDQPLEPLLLENIVGTIVVPHNLFSTAEGAAYPLAISKVLNENRLVILADRREGTALGAQDGNLGIIALSVALKPRSQTAIGHTPNNLFELHELLAENGDDLLSIVRAKIVAWSGLPSALHARLVIILSAPKVRSPGGAVESTDTWAFVTMEKVSEIGIAVGQLAMHEGQLGTLIPPDSTLQGREVTLALLNVVHSLSRDAAARSNGFDTPSDLVIVVIGCGALGSQVVMNAARAGFGRWTLIDNDVLLPHNLARHSLGSTSVGESKAHAVAAIARGLTEPAGPFGAIDADLLEPRAYSAQIAESLKNADCIIDLSASLTVARHLTRIQSDARRLSVFLNPTGTDLVLLAEDKERQYTLDTLEAQYYRFLIREPSLQDHLRPPADRIRYGRSCRDVTVRMPQARVGMFAGIGAEAFRKAMDTDAAAITIWRGERDGSVNVSRSAPRPGVRHQIGDWTFVADVGLFDIIARLRREKLPNETGGVLLGWFDLDEKTVHVVDTIASPPDSEEWPTLYIRGCKGLPKRIELATLATGEQVHYVGEWHSHPDGHSCDPSSDDAKVFAWLTEHMYEHGLPAVMSIAGQHDEFALFIGRMAVGESRARVATASAEESVSGQP
jgi:ThiF family/Prokaryotic homologs of the JAB domain